MNLHISFKLAVWSIVAVQQFGYAANDWNQWLGGPERQNAAREDWVIPANQRLVPRLEWKRDIGSGYSAVAIRGKNLVCLMNDGASDTAVLLNADNGKEVWGRRLGKKYKGHDGSIDGPLSTPAINDRFVFAISAYGKLVCLNAKDGTEVWTRNLAWDFGSKTPHYGFATSPLLLDDRVIVQAGGKGVLGDGRSLVALTIESGEVLWQVAGDGNDYRSPALAKFAGVPQVISQGDGRVFSVSPTNGAELWSIDVGTTSSWTPMPLDQDRIFISAAERSVLLKVSLTANGWKVKKLWVSERIAGTISPLARMNDLLIGVQTRKLAGLSLKDGELAWKSKTDAFPIRAGNRIVALADREGVLKVGKVSSNGWQPEAELKLYDNPDSQIRVESPMAYANGMLYIRTDFAIFAVSFKEE